MPLTFGKGEGAVLYLLSTQPLLWWKIYSYWSTPAQYEPLCHAAKEPRKELSDNQTCVNYAFNQVLEYRKGEFQARLYPSHKTQCRGRKKSLLLPVHLLYVRIKKKKRRLVLASLMASYLAAVVQRHWHTWLGTFLLFTVFRSRTCCIRSGMRRLACTALMLGVGCEEACDSSVFYVSSTGP